MAEKKMNAELTRREFGRRAVVGAATAAMLPGELLARPARTSRAPQTAAQETKLSADSQAEVDAKVAAIMRKYGARFSEAQKADIRRLVMEGQKPLETMRAFALDNGDQPANVMKIYPDGAAERTAARKR